MVEIPSIGGVWTSEFAICNLQFAIFRLKYCCNTLIYKGFYHTVWKNCKLQIANSYPV